MKQRRRLISMLLVLLLTGTAVLNVGAADIKDMKDKQQQLQNEQKAAEEEQKTLEAKVKELSNSMKKMETELDDKRTEIEDTEQELIMTRIQEEEQYKSMKLRIQYMYENGNANMFEILLESESLGDFFAKAEYVKKMSEYDRKKIEEFQVVVRTVEEKELTLQAEYEDLMSMQAELNVKRQEAEDLLDAKSSQVASLKSDLQDLKKRIKNAEAEEKKRQEAANATNNQGSSSSGQAGPPVVSGNGYFTHPCPGMSYQSSYFGEVRQGIGDTKPHKGHDYAAPAGTPIYAAAAGTVTIAGYSSSAGYWVVINHGNGLVTKYMHMYQSPLVSTGQTVQKGQHIGGVGTTGQSTGNHLHFQVELNGTAVNPSNYM